MDASLYDHYKTLPNTELLTIARQTSDYTPEAIETVRRVLEERQVTEADEREVEERFESLAVEAEQRLALRQKANAILTTPFYGPDGYTAQKWLPILLIVWGGQYLWSLYRSRQLYYMVFTAALGFETLTVFGDLLLHLLTFYLLYKRHRWGWSLLFAYNMMAFFPLGTMVYVWIKAPFPRWPDPGVTAEHLVIGVAIFLFLWREDITGYFKVTRRWKLRTILVACVVELLIALSPMIF